MSFTKQLEESLSYNQFPEEWRARHVIKGEEGELVTGPIAPVATDSDLLIQFG